MLNKIAEIFGGNPHLKRAGVQVEWTPEMVKEYLRCQRDKKYFITTYVKIINVDKGLINFELWDFQQRIIDTASENRFTICCLPRQCGKTTTTAADILHSVLFNSEYVCAILANQEKQAKEILARVKLMFEHLPDFLKVGVTSWNKTSINLANKSRVIAGSTSSSSLRGMSINYLLLDEFAHVKPWIAADFVESVMPTIASGTTTKVVVTSTPLGLGNMFHKMWADSEAGKNTYARVEVKWNDIPGRDDRFRAEQIANNGERTWRQEYCAEFLGSSNTLVDAGKLAQLARGSDPIMSQGNVDVWEKPQENHAYMVTVDTSRGVGIDYSVFVVFDITTVPYRIVAKFRRDDVPAMTYPNHVYQAAVTYNNAWVLVETNDVGSQVADILHADMEYEGMLWTYPSVGKGAQLEGGGGKPRLGVMTTKGMKRVGCANLKSLIEQDKLLIPDEDLIDELYVFVEKNASYQASEGNHDDIVMCCVLFSWMVNQPYFKELTDTDARRALIDAKQRDLEESAVPFGFNDSGPEDDEFAPKPEDWWMWTDPKYPDAGRSPDPQDMQYPLRSDKYARPVQPDQAPPKPWRWGSN